MEETARRIPEPAPPPPPARRRFTLRFRPSQAGGRYTRFVTWMRIILPVVAGVVVLLVVIWPQLTEDAGRFALMAPSAVTLKDGGDQQVVNARFTGMDRNQQPFTVIADSATQSQQMPDRVSLAFPKADVTMKNGAWVALSGANGLYYRNRQALDLNGDVTLFHDSGFEMRTAAAHIDFNTNIASGDSPVQGQGPLGTLDAKGFRVVEGGRRIWFAGPSQVVFWPKAQEEQK